MMKIKPIPIAAIFIIAFGGIYLYSQRKTTSSISNEPITLQESKPADIPEPSPNRPLKEGEKFIGSIGVYVTVPEGMNFRQYPATEHAVNFYIESGPLEKPTYQFYAVYQPSSNMAEKGLEQAKKEMDPKTIKEAIVGGYKGIEGLVTGPKARYHTMVIKDDRLISFSTYPPTEENKAITEQILSTIAFQ
jgi:hypothetical protein